MPSQTDMTVQRLEEKLKSNPDSLVFSRLADSFRKSGDVQQAITICSKGVQSHPDYVTGRIILGRCYLEQENFNDAIKEFTKVCRLDRRNQIAIKMLADVFSKQGMEEKAGDLFNMLLKMDDENQSLQHLVTVFKGSNRTNLFEILGVEDIGAQTAPPPKTEDESADLQGAEEALEEAGILDAEDSAADTLTDMAPDTPEMVQEAEMPDMGDADVPVSDTIAEALPEAADAIDEAGISDMADVEAPLSDTSTDTIPEAADVLDEAGITDMADMETPLSDIAPEAEDVTEEAEIPDTGDSEVPPSDTTAEALPEAADTIDEAGISDMADMEAPLSDIAPEAESIPEEAEISEAADDILEEAGLSEKTEDQADALSDPTAGTVEEEAPAAPETITDEAAEAGSLESADDFSSQTLEDALVPETAEEPSSSQEIASDNIAVPEMEELAESIPELHDQEVGLQEEQPEPDITPESLTAEESPSDDILPQEADTLEEVSVLDDIPAQSEDTVSDAQNLVTETEMLPEEESAGTGVTDLLVETGEAETVAEEEILVPVDENQESVEVEVPDKDDISMRMDAMFGDDSKGEETGTGTATTDTVEGLISGTDEDTIAVAADFQDSSRLSDVFADDEEDSFSSRVENLFGGEEKIAEIVTEKEMEPEPAPVDELIPPVEVGSAATEILDREGLDGISEPDAERPAAVEEVDSGMTQPEPEVMDISTEVESSFEEPVADKEMATAATEIIDVDTPKTPVSEETSESLVTDATAVFDRDMIRKISASESKKLSEVIDEPVSDVPAPQTSLSSEEVISRLDEMFPVDDEPEKVHDTHVEKRDISMELPVDEEIGSLQEGSFAETAELSIKPDEILGKTREIPVLPKETAASADDRPDNMSMPLETKEYLPDQVGGREDKQTESFEMDTIETDEPFTGEEVASRIDEMFTGEDDLGDTSLASIPDEDTDDQEPISEFYSESGDMASLEETAAAEEGEKEVQVGAVTEEFSLDGDLDEMGEEDSPDEAADIFPTEEGAAFDEVAGEFAEESDDADTLVISKAASEDDVFAEETISSDLASLEETGAESGEEVPAAGTTDAGMTSTEELSLTEKDVFADDESLTSIPDEDTMESEPVGEFYTESGDTAALEETVTELEEGIRAESTETSDIIPEEGEQTGEFHVETGEAAFVEDEETAVGKGTQTEIEETAVYEMLPDDELAVVGEETAIDDVSIEAIPDEDIDESEPVSEFYTETGEIAAPDETEDVDKTIEEAVSEEFREGLPESDSTALDDRMLPEDQISSDSLEEEVLDEIDFDSEVSDEFYTISGDDTPIPPAGNGDLPRYDKEGIPKEEKGISESADEETLATGADSLPPADAKEEKTFRKKEDIAAKANSIPDHVLTPTLADIYYQQDQPYLAIQIYKRLLERDPDNERIAGRITEIEQVIKEREAQTERSAVNGKAAKTTTVRKRKSSSRKKKPAEDGRPLKGIRIKKKVKERIRKKKNT